MQHVGAVDRLAPVDLFLGIHVEVACVQPHHFVRRFEPEQLRQRRVRRLNAAVLAGSVDADGAPIEQRTVAFFALAQRPLRLLLHHAQLLILQGAVHRRAQPRRPVLQHVVIRPIAQGVDGRLFADTAGDNDERDVQAAGIQQLQGVQAAEVRQAPIGQDQFGRVFERQEVFGLRFRPAASQVRIPPAADEAPSAPHHRSCLLRSGPAAESAWRTSLRYGLSGGASLSTSQYRPRCLIASTKPWNSTGLRT